MAKKRMFAMTIVDSDAFLDMPISTQLLYFHLNMRADDDGFIGNPKRIQRLINSNDDDLKLLLAKRFILAFEDGVIVIKHWKIHNTIQADRYTPTVYQEELQALLLKDNKAYSLTNGKKLVKNVSKMETKCFQNVSTDIDIDKDIDKDIDLYKEKNNKKRKTQFTPPTVEEVQAYIDEKFYNVDAEAFIDFYQSKDWYIGKNKMKDWKAAIRTWHRNNRTLPNKSSTGNPFLDLLEEEESESNW